MDGFTEKKWFVYLGDHHEGPFSLEDVQTKMVQGQLSSTNYVWAEGMPDWKLMTQVQAFDSIVAPPPPLAAVDSVKTPEIAPALTAIGPSSDFAAISIEPQIAEPAFTTGATVAAEPMLYSHVEKTATSEISPEASADDEVLRELQNQKKALFRSMAKVVALLLIVAGAGFAYTEGYLTPLLNSQSLKGTTQSLANLAEPLLTSLGISPLPKLDDVEQEEYEGLKTAAKANIAQAGPQFAMAVSKTDLLSPTFYVATNLPDGAILDLYIEGISDSLLGQLSFNSKAQVTISKKFGKTAAIQFPPTAKAMIRGQYTIYVVDPETQPTAVKNELGRAAPVQTTITPTSVPKGLRVLATKSYFLGGPKDATYTQRLQEYHQKLTAKAQAELSEVKQIAATFDAKLAETNAKFAQLKKAKRIGPAQKKSWGAYHAQWTQLYAQFAQLFGKLTPETVQNEYFYGFLYQLCQQTGDSLNQLHNLQNTFFTGSVGDAKAFDIQLGEVNAIAKSAIDVLKAKIDQVAALPPTPNGLPKRDAI